MSILKSLKKKKNHPIMSAPWSFVKPNLHLTSQVHTVLSHSLFPVFSDDAVKSTNNPAFPKKQKSFLMRQIRGLRSKVIKKVVAGLKYMLYLFTLFILLCY